MGGNQKPTHNSQFAIPNSQFARLLLIANLLIILSLACSLPSVLTGGSRTPTPGPKSEATPTRGAPTPTPQPLPPALVEIDPPPGAELPLEGPITLYFNQPMQRDTVEQALFKQVAAVGDLNWVDDATLVIQPEQPLAPESLVSLNIGSSARAASGLALTQPISLTFQTAGYLRLAQSLPEPDAAEIDPTSAVVASFNRPVVPLGADPAGLPAAFSLEPQAEGRGEWLNTSTYVFYPDPGLEGGKSYTVQINPDLHSTDGSPLEDAGEWSFTTASPALVSLVPQTQSPALRLDDGIVLTFNQTMDRASVEANFRLLDPNGTAVPGAFEWGPVDTNLGDGLPAAETGLDTVVTFRSSDLLERGGMYRAVLDGQAQGRGGTPVGSTVEVDLTTAAPLAVTRSDPAPGAQKQPYTGIVLYFSAPIITRDQLNNPNTDQSLGDKISFSPAVPNVSTWWDESQWALNIYGEFDPSASYTLNLSPEISDAWGSALAAPYSLSFTTAPLDPQVNLNFGSEFIFLTPQDATFTVQATNLTDLPVRRGSVPLEDFLRMVGPGGYDFRSTYQAPDEASWTQALTLLPNRVQPVELPVSPDGSPLDPGIYMFRFIMPRQDLYGGPYLFVVSNIQMTYKVSATDALVWAVDLRSGQPAAGQLVTLYDENGRPMTSGETDEQGVFRASLSPRADPYNTSYAALGQPGEENFSLAVSSWSQGINPWDFNLTYTPQPPRLMAYLYTDRPIYRPGQTIYFRAVVRQAYNGRYTLPEQGSLQLKVFGAFGNELDTIDLPLSAFGTGHGQYTLTSDAQSGYYSLSVPDDRYGWSAVSFQVADYRKPEINLQVSIPDEQVLAGNTFSASVNARYFFDAPAGNVPVNWALYAAPEPFQLSGFRVGAEELNWLRWMPGMFGGFGGPGIQVATGESQTDPQGLLDLDLPTVFEDFESIPRSSRLRLTLEVTLQDESGLPVSARAEILVNPSDIYIGVRPDTWTSQAGQQIGFDVQVVDWEGSPGGARALRADFQKVVWERQEATTPYTGPTFTPRYTPVASTDFSTSDAGQARLAFTPEEPGTYQLDVSSPDGALTQFILWVGGPGQAVWPNLPDQRLRLVPDRDLYVPGDTAQVFVPNPFGVPVLALMTVERSVVLSHEVFTLEAGGTTLSLPLGSDEAPNVFLSVTVLGKTPEGRPDFRQGYTGLEVQPVEQVLNVTLTSQPQRAGPGDEVSFEIQVTDAAGQPVQGEFSLAVIDLAALSLADPNSQDILPAFYGKQPLGVQTGLALAAYAHRQTLPPVGGGGGGGADVPPVVRESFPDTAYWNAEVITDADGRAQVTVSLPDTLTTWQIDLRGVTDDTRVGQAASQVITSKDLLVRPVTPRFLVVDDHTQLAAIVQNNTSESLEAEVALQASGFALDDPGSAVQMVSVPANGRARVEWWGTAQEADSADLVFTATAGSLQDATRPALGALPILHYSAPQTFATSGIVAGADTLLELVSLPRSFDPRGGSLDIEMAPSLGTAMLNALEALEAFPYDCTEQTVSRFLPNLETYRTLQEFNIEAPELQERLERTLGEGLQRLLSRQNFDGGWGWWQNETESDPYISAYAVYGLLRARSAGSTINQDALQRAVDYLRASLVSPVQVEAGWQLDRLAFQHFVLTLAEEAGFGETDPSAAEALFDQRTELSPWAQALLALTFESQDPGSPSAGTLLSDLESTALRSATGVHWEAPESAVPGAPDLRNMTTTLSNSAIVLYALAQRDPATPLVADALRYLMAHRSAGGAWESTYSTAWTLMALNQVMRGTGEVGGDFTFTASLNGAPVASGQAGGAGIAPPVMASVPISSLYPDNPNALAIQRGEGAGRLYYTAGLTVNRPVETVAPLDRGVLLTREYYPAPEPCTGADCPAGASAPVESAQAGQQVKVRLTLTVPNDAYYLMVEDYIPAGAEILDTSLKTSQQGEFIPPEEGQPEPLKYDPRNPFAEGWGWWLFNAPQIYDDHIAWSIDSLPAGTYELNYTLTILQPGQYQVLPARAWQFYFPEVQGNSAGAVFEVLP